MLSDHIDTETQHLAKKVREEGNLLIGFSGKKRVGKDTAADHLADRKHYTKIAFADPIKEAAASIFRFNDEQLYGDLKETVDPYWGFAPRWAMQVIGTDLFREQVDEGVWIKSLLRKVLQEKPLYWTICDVRFPNELAAIKAAGGYVVRVKRPEVEPELSTWKKRIVEIFPSLFTLFGSEYHPSEIALDDFGNAFDYRLINNRSLPSFVERVNKILSRIEELRPLPFS